MTPARRIGALPNMLIIGAAKAGTTSLHYYLNLHPEIQMSREKELHFFSEPDCWARGVNWYRSHFDSRIAVRGEASVTYTNAPSKTGIPEKIKSVLPDAKLIYILRDPIARIMSAWVQQSSLGEEDRPIEEALRILEGNGIVERSCYHHQLQQYLPHFGLSRILILTLEEMRSDRPAVLRRAFEFLDVDADFVSPGFDRIKNRSRLKRRKGPVGMMLYRLSVTAPARILSSSVRRDIGKVLYRPFSTKIEPPVIEASTRTRLEEFLRDDVASLRELTGQEFPDWTL